MTANKHYLDGFWNVEPAKYRVVVVEIGPEPDEQRIEAERWMNGRKRYLWFVPFIGKYRQAVEVSYGDSIFYLDNADGSGLMKVTTGMGSPRMGHRTLYPANVGMVVPADQVVKWSADLETLVGMEIEGAWMEIDPKGYADHKNQMEALREVIRKGAMPLRTRL